MILNNLVSASHSSRLEKTEQSAKSNFYTHQKAALRIRIIFGVAFID
jgi:hypothetical protein